MALPAQFVSRILLNSFKKKNNHSKIHKDEIRHEMKYFDKKLNFYPIFVFDFSCPVLVIDISPLITEKGPTVHPQYSPSSQASCRWP